MNTKLVFAVSHQGETEYKVCGGDYDGRTLRVCYATEAYYRGLLPFLRTPLERNMMEEVAQLAGTVSFVGGEDVPLELLVLARNLQRCAVTLCPDVASRTLEAAKLNEKGAWIRYEPAAPSPSIARKPVQVLHPVFAAAREAAAQRRSAAQQA